MKHYINHILSLFNRPVVNGINGTMELRSASPFELFLDLIIVVALSKLTTLLALSTPLGFFEATLLFIIIYSHWHTLTTYTVMFMKKEINYWTRLMIFIVMLPLIFFLSVSDLQNKQDIFIFCSSLAVSKLLLALIYRDSIVNAPLNNIVISRLYIGMAKGQAISAVLLLLAGFSPNQFIFLGLLTIVAIREAIIAPHRKRKFLKRSFAPLLINKQLFTERQLLFIILIFGESIVTLVNDLAANANQNTFINIILVFSIMFMFYMRISEETEYNRYLINLSDNLPYWLVTDYVIFVLFFILSTIPHQIHEHGSLPTSELAILIIIQLYIATSHMHSNISNLRVASNSKAKIFYQVDIRAIVGMYIVTLTLLLFHQTTFIIYIQVLIYFFFHIIALPFREHLIREKCDLVDHVNR